MHYYLYGNHAGKTLRTRRENPALPMDSSVADCSGGRKLDKCPAPFELTKGYAPEWKYRGPLDQRSSNRQNYGARLSAKQTLSLGIAIVVETKRQKSTNFVE